jgi:hypothetical protein
LSKKLKETVQRDFLAFLRVISNCNTPLIAALYRLFNKAKLVLSERLAIEEGFFSLFSSLLKDNNLIDINNLEKGN